MDKNFEFPQFWGFSENVNILGYGHFFRYFLGIPSKFDYFMGLCLILRLHYVPGGPGSPVC